jgi:hypothetical protein
MRPHERTVSNTDLVLEILEANSPAGLCDDHISIEAGIPNRIQVNQLCNRLAERGLISRAKGTCARGDGPKLINSIRGSKPASSEVLAKQESLPPIGQGPPILIAWRHIDRFCRAVWQQHIKEDTKLPLFELVNSLRDKRLISLHTANMMHTIRVIRNEIVHDDGPDGRREQTIVTAAYSVTAEWAEAQEPGLWHLTAR